MNQEDNNQHNPYRAFIIIAVAALLLFGLSFLPLGKLSGGFIKDFDLLSDLTKSDTTKIDTSEISTEGLDPELVKAMESGESTDGVVLVDSTGKRIVAPADSILIPIKPARVGEMVQIEDYTLKQGGMEKLRKALASGRLARVAVVGDSYIEGDIMTQDLRDELQTTYGGSGVGYVNMHSEFPGFRRSVKQGGSGWTEFTATKKGTKEYFGLSQHYFTPQGVGKSTYAGTSALTNTASWDNSQFLFIAPKGGTVKLKNDATESWTIHTINPSNEVQQLSLPGNTTEFAVETSSPSIVGLGVWLDGANGISVDCMSSRGFSGISLASVTPELCRSMSKFVNYDLIILEFGINAMTANQTNYSVYAKRMKDVVDHVRECYPNADILLMGVGDRGVKKGGAVQSMASAKYMIDAQRDIARKTHAFFWDTREAMGGEGAIVAWAGDGMANKDYIHLTHKGGKKLASLLANAIRQNLKL